MEKTFAIFWMAPESQRCGVGKAQFTREEAETLAAELNQEHPSFVHTVINTSQADLNEIIAQAKVAMLTPVRDNIISFPELAANDAATREAIGL